MKGGKSNFRQEFLIVGAMSYYGTFPLMKIEKKTKTSHVYITEALQPLLHEFILLLFGLDSSKVFVHFDKATIHVSSFLQLYMDLMTGTYGIKFI